MSTPFRNQSVGQSIIDGIPQDDLPERSAPQTIRLAIGLPLIVIATIGNTLSFLVMRRKTMKNTSPGIYFAAIAVADTMTVYWGLIPFVIYYFSSVDLWNLHPWSCRVVIFTLFTSADSAIWLLVAITGDRFISVILPLRRKAMCTPRRALIVAVLLPTIAVLKNFHLFFTRERQVIPDDDTPEKVGVCGGDRLFQMMTYQRR